MANNSTEKRHQQILDTVTELLALKPTATLQEMADYSKIGIATLHRHFTTREILLDEIALNAINLVNQKLKQINFNNDNVEGTLYSIFEALIPVGNKIFFLASAASVDENQKVVTEEKRMKQTIINIVEKWQKKGLLNKNISSKWIVSNMQTTLFLAWQEIHKGNLAKNEAPQLLTTVALKGFSK